jgi:hypothetical protein
VQTSTKQKTDIIPELKPSMARAPKLKPKSTKVMRPLRPDEIYNPKVHK